MLGERSCSELEAGELRPDVLQVGNNGDKLEARREAKAFMLYVWLEVDSGLNEGLQARGGRLHSVRSVLVVERPRRVSREEP